MSISTDNWEQVEAAAKASLGDEIVQFIAQCRQEDAGADSHLVAVLHRVQGHFGYLGEEHLDAVAQLLQVPAAKVAGVASFYHYFRLKPRGRFLLSVCMGTACYVKGAERVAQRVMDELGITWGETSKDGLFTLDPSRCLGTCGLAPVVMVEDEVHGNVTPDQVPAILEQYRHRAREQGHA
ncbi:MAG: NADH-quinone oxidoreductase subunit NuoE [Pirellulales bacterium]|nr:NADH-quinone oxidoreductase subunit NuoE [Pirellulales bacterium]